MSKRPSPRYENNCAFAAALRQWVWQYQWYQYYYQTAAMLPMTIACNYQQLMAFNAHQNNWRPITSTDPVQSVPTVGQRPNLNQQTPPFNQNQGAAIDQVSGNEGQGRQYRIPPLWKRLAAECIDFILLFVIKLALTIIAVEYFSIIDLDKWGKYDLEALFKQDLDYNAAFNVTSELIAMEIVNRIIVTFFEALCLRQGVGGVPGGTTPGKRAMGIAVVTCQHIVTLDQHRVIVRPAQDLGFLLAFVRSLLKNFSMAFFLPASLTVLVFSHKRAVYDVVAGCIVVEAGPQAQAVRPRRR